MWNETKYRNEKEERQVNNMKFKEIFGDSDWEEWIEECNITEEELEKLKTKHTEYVIQSVHYISGKYIGMKYLITFLQEDEIVDCVALQAFGIDLRFADMMLVNVYKNLRIWYRIMDKIDECRNDGTHPRRPTREEFFQAYIELSDEALRRLGKGGDES